MRILKSLLLCLLLPAVALPQGRPILEGQFEVEFGGPGEGVVAHKFVAAENKLVLVGRKAVRVLDVASGKLSESRPVDVPEYTEDKPRLISPDGRRMVVFGNYESDRKADKVKRPASVWDLQTGKLMATLDKTAKPVRAAVWSRNGKTLATSSDKYAPLLVDSSSVEVSFWDGETLAYKNSLPTDKVGWWRLTADGEKCFYSTGEVKGRIPVIEKEYVSPEGAPSVWDIGSGKVERAVSVRDRGAEMKIPMRDISPDESFLVLYLQPPKSKEAEMRLAFWEIDKSNPPRYEFRPKYEISPQQKSMGVAFSPSGKYFYVDVGKTRRIYETRTGEQKLELADFDSWSTWLTDDTFYSRRNTKLKVFDAATGKELHQQKLVYDAYSETPGGWSEPSGYLPQTQVTRVLDETEIALRPGGAMFLTYSKQYVKVFDTRTGALLQTLVEPPVDNTKKKPKLSDEPLVYKADWSADGHTLYVISADKRRVSLWRLP